MGGSTVNAISLLLLSDFKQSLVKKMTSIERKLEVFVIYDVWNLCVHCNLRSYLASDGGDDRKQQMRTFRVCKNSSTSSKICVLSNKLSSLFCFIVFTFVQKENGVNLSLRIGSHCFRWFRLLIWNEKQRHKNSFFQMRDGASVAVSLRIVGYATVSGLYWFWWRLRSFVIALVFQFEAIYLWIDSFLLSRLMWFMKWWHCKTLLRGSASYLRRQKHWNCFWFCDKNHLSRSPCPFQPSYSASFYPSTEILKRWDFVKGSSDYCSYHAGNLHTLRGSWVCSFNIFSDRRLQPTVSCECGVGG